jgi:NAD(P)-dependent dehydrogenase (short-subunit alcohol dehydrogenase family)
MQADRHAGRSVIVTGGSSGIGRGIALRFAEEGADVAIADVRREPKQGKRFETEVETPTDAMIDAEHAGEAIYVETEVSDPDAAAAMVDATVDAFGGVDVLVNNAGIYIPGDSQELSPAEWDEVLGVDLDGTFFCAKAAIPQLRERSGAIVNIGSVHASEGGAGPAYPSAKAAVVNLTRDLAVELGDDAVNVNCICPGFVKTAVQDYHTEESLRREMEERTLLPEVADPEDIGDVAVWLASDEASFVHGETIYADGGWTAHRG